MTVTLVLEDAITFIKIQKSENYKERLKEAYDLVLQSGIKNYEEFYKSNLGIGAFQYSEITIFDRLKNEEYYRILNGYYLEVQPALDASKDLGDVLASYGTVGKTPYREEFIKNGFITTGLTEEEKNKFYR